MSGKFPQRPVFTAEKRLQMLQRRGMPAPNVESDPESESEVDAGPPPAPLSTSDFLRIELGQALETLRQELRQDIDTLISDKLQGMAVATPASGSDSAADAPAQTARPAETPAISSGGLTAEEELIQIKSEIRKMSDTINRTKQEIAAIYSTSLDNKRMDVMRDELGSVVKDTEVATSTILESMEIIDETAQFIKSATRNEEIAGGSDNILDQVVRVFETCNFQDLTGQRINKVVNTMKFIEERVNNLVGIWGEEDLSQYDKEEVKGLDNLDKTLATTDTEKEKVTQEEIDKLFG